MNIFIIIIIIINYNFYNIALYCSKEEFLSIFGNNNNNNNINLQSLGVPLSPETEAKVFVPIIIKFLPNDKNVRTNKKKKLEHSIVHIIV